MHVKKARSSTNESGTSSHCHNLAVELAARITKRQDFCTHRLFQPFLAIINFCPSPFWWNRGKCNVIEGMTSNFEPRRKLTNLLFRDDLPLGIGGGYVKGGIEPVLIE